MSSKNKLLSKGGLVSPEPVEEKPAAEIALDLLPDVAYPTWMKHASKDSIIVNSKKEYYDAVNLGYEATDRCVKI